MPIAEKPFPDQGLFGETRFRFPEGIDRKSYEAPRGEARVIAVLFHVKASTSYGWGHIVRASRLAGTLRPWADCRFVVDGPAEAEAMVPAELALLGRIEPDRPQPRDALALLGDWRPEVVVFDMLRPDLAALSAYRRIGARVLVMSDEGVACPDADLVLSPNPRELWHEPDAAIVGGTDYVLVPPSLARLRGLPPAHPPSRLLVNTGGATTRRTFDAMVPILRRLEESGLEGTYVTGFASDLPADVQQGLTRFEVVPAGRDLAALVADAGAAFVTAGYIRYELAFVGVPMALTAIVDHQHVFGEWLARHGAADYCGPLHETDPERVAGRVRAFVADEAGRARRRATAMAMVDGHGGERIGTLIAGLASSAPRGATAPP